ncbi:hypothetical protein HCN44_011064, partial [Aphidius gifuensis]
ITLTLWKDEAENFIGKVGQIIKIERGKIKEYLKDKYISLINSSKITYDCQNDKQKFKEWLALESQSKQRDDEKPCCSKWTNTNKKT